MGKGKKTKAAEKITSPENLDKLEKELKEEYGIADNVENTETEEPVLDIIEKLQETEKEVEQATTINEKDNTLEAIGKKIEELEKAQEKLEKKIQSIDKKAARLAAYQEFYSEQ